MTDPKPPEWQPPTTPVTEYIIGVPSNLDPELQAMIILQQALTHAFDLLPTSTEYSRVWEWIDDRAHKAMNEKDRGA